MPTPDLTTGGTARPIVLYGTPVLHSPCAEVTAFDADLEQLLRDMFASMYAAHGVGLAANQIGVDARVFVYDCPDDDDVMHLGHIVNPVLEEVTGRRELILDDEGCLSVPGPHGELGRISESVVTGVDLQGAPIRIEGTGHFARCLQHETDHLNGLLYVDRLPARRRRKILAEAGLEQ